MGKFIKIYKMKLPLDLEDMDLSDLICCLNDEEKDRYSRHIYKNQFLISRLFIRSILSELLDVSFYEITFKREKYGKPYLSDQTVIKDISFSKTEGFMIFGVTNLEKLGVDVELIKQIELVHLKGAFSTEEYEFIESGKEESLMQRRFYHMWTRKEALSKLLGTGFYIEPKDIRVNIYNDWEMNEDIKNLTFFYDKWIITLCYKMNSLSKDLVIDNVNVTFNSLVNVSERSISQI